MTQVHNCYAQNPLLTDGRLVSESQSTGVYYVDNESLSMGNSQAGFLDGVPLLGGAVFGALAYVCGFVTTYLLVVADGGLEASAVIETSFGDVGLFDLGFPQPEPSTVEFSGWIFYNAHFVETVFSPDIPTTANPESGALGESRNLLSSASTQIPELLYYLVPVVLLAGCGYLLARRNTVHSLREAAKTGVTLLGGYFPLALLGTFLFTASKAGERNGIEVTTTGGPTLGTVLVVAAVFPILFGTAGAWLAISSE